MEMNNLDLGQQVLINDIDICLKEKRIDNAMLFFVHIYEQLSDDVRNKEIKKVFEDFRKAVVDLDYMNNLALFYQILESPEEGKLLLDRNINYSENYTLDESLYETILKDRLRLFSVLGKVKRNMTVVSAKEW